jgi:hypothetical protein
MIADDFMRNRCTFKYLPISRWFRLLYRDLDRKDSFCWHHKKPVRGQFSRSHRLFNATRPGSSQPNADTSGDGSDRTRATVTLAWREPVRRSLRCQLAEESQGRTDRDDAEKGRQILHRSSLSTCQSCQPERGKCLSNCNAFYQQQTVTTEWAKGTGVT